jgi:hypothetical protein
MRAGSTTVDASTLTITPQVQSGHRHHLFESSGTPRPFPQVKKHLGKGARSSGYSSNINRNYSAILATLQITSYALGVGHSRYPANNLVRT